MVYYFPENPEILQNVLSVLWNGAEKYFKAGSWLKHAKTCQFKFWIYELFKVFHSESDLKTEIMLQKKNSFCFKIICGFKISINGSILFSDLKEFDFIWDNNVKGRGIN